MSLTWGRRVQRFVGRVMEKELTQEEKSTNAETWEHINNVMKLLARMQFELSQRMFAHDRSKLSPPEVSVFTTFTPKLKDSTYGSEEYKGFLRDMKPALEHHYANNRHHPEHFENGVCGMNLIDVLEMLCDWKAATIRHNDGDINRSIELNTKRFDLCPQLVSIIKNTVPLLKNIFDHELSPECWCNPVQDSVCKDVFIHNDL